MRIILRNEGFNEQAELKAFAGRRTGGVGALASFAGYCRDRSGEGADLDYLHLDYYPGFTETEIERLAAATAKRHDIIDLLVIHRTGRVAPHDPIVLVAALAVHRAAAFAAVAELMDYLKTDAPFWKREVGGGQSSWIEPTGDDRARRKTLGD